MSIPYYQLFLRTMQQLFWSLMKWLEWWGVKFACNSRCHTHKKSTSDLMCAVKAVIENFKINISSSSSWYVFYCFGSSLTHLAWFEEGWHVNKSKDAVLRFHTLDNFIWLIRVWYLSRSTIYKFQNMNNVQYRT